MTEYDIQQAVLTVLHRRHGRAPRELHIEDADLAGGLEAGYVRHITAHYCDGYRRRRRFTCVVKWLQGAATREASVYRHLLEVGQTRLLPEVFRIEQGQSGDHAVLLLEDLCSDGTWHWRNVAATADVLRELAAFHNSTRTDRCLPPWDYENELQESAITTLEQLEAMHRAPEWSSLIAAGLRATRRLVCSLEARRAALLRFGPFDNATIHGDVHSGNVLIRRLAGRSQPVLIDWARARRGSALEDVSSWLQSLAYWEPEARRRHDTLLKEYLGTHGGVTLSSDVRGAYWAAGASNALAGALRYHCWRASVGESVDSRRAAALCARDWLRVITRADALSA